MKLQINKTGQQEIAGYEQVTVEKPNSLELSHIVDNSCESILCPDIMDMFHLSALNDLCVGLLKKLRMGGELVIGGIDVRLFAKYVTNGLLAPEEASNIVCKTYSMSTPDLLRSCLEKLQLKVVSIHMDGLHYEIKAVRS